MKNVFSVHPFLLLFLIATVESIRLPPESLDQKFQKEGEMGGGNFKGGVVVCKDGDCSGIKNSRVFPARETLSRIPAFQADYGGPKGHSPKNN